MNICVLGRQPEIGLAELEALYGDDIVRPVGSDCATVNADIDFSRLGGTVKSARLVSTLSSINPKSFARDLEKITTGLAADLPEGKIKLGFSFHGFSLDAYSINGIGLGIKKSLRKIGRSVRIVPSEAPSLSSAQTYHNQLTSNLGIELLVVRDGEKTLVGRVEHVQNIDGYRIRDRERPKRDTFVGMLPPKLAQIIVNLAVAKLDLRSQVCILDPFCGTGVVLQEALLMGYDVYGTDLSPKMIDYTRANLDWLQRDSRWQKTEGSVVGLQAADATTHTWETSKPFVIATETYLGQPLGGQKPSEEKLQEIIHDSNRIVRDFLKNIASQINSGTGLCLAVPAWFVNGKQHQLPVVEDIDKLGFEQQAFKHINQPLIYRREDQVTAREMLVLRKK